jgi:ADP-ribose pyrophosphatase
VVRDVTSTAKPTGGFLNLRRVELSLRYPDGSTSPPFAYDLATRTALDAVVFLVHFQDPAGTRHVFLRSAVRPPVALRPIPPLHDGNLWEVPAGIIDPNETPEAAAAREIGEELGFQVAPSDLAELGPWTLPAPGVIGERHVFCHVEVDPRTRGVPKEDGPLEHAGVVLALPLDAALAHCREGAIRDAKSELALRRLAELP